MVGAFYYAGNIDFSDIGGITKKAPFHFFYLLSKVWVRVR